MTDSTRLIASLMKGTCSSWPVDSQETDADVLRLLHGHGATPLVAYHLRRTPLEMPASLAAQIAVAGRVHAAHEIVRGHELHALFVRLAASGIPVLIIKGAALAQTHYPESSLRPRCDTDVLIERETRVQTAEILGAAGYREEPNSGGEVISRQRTWIHTDNLGIDHRIDLHWALSNRPRYATAFSFWDLWSRSLPLHGSGIRMPAPVDALLLAAIHLAGHHSDSERLIWLYDIHLLHAALSAEELNELAMRARERKIVMALDVALALALCWFGDGERIAPQRDTRTQIETFLEDLRWTRGLRMKFRLVREHLLPPPSYVLHKYAVRSRSALPALYIHRALKASAKLLRRG